MIKQFIDFYLQNVTFKIAILTIALFLGLLSYVNENILGSLYLLGFKNSSVMVIAPIFWFLVINLVFIYSIEFYKKYYFPAKTKRKIIKRFHSCNPEELQILFNFYDEKAQHFASTRELIANNGLTISLVRAGLINQVHDRIYENRLSGVMTGTFSLNRGLLNHINSNKLTVLKTYFGVVLK